MSALHATSASEAYLDIDYIGFQLTRFTFRSLGPYNTELA